MQAAEAALRAEQAAADEHEAALNAVDSAREALRATAEQQRVECCAQAAAAEELGCKRAEILRLHESMAAASQEMQSKHAANAVEAAARLSEAQEVRGGLGCGQCEFNAGATCWASVMLMQHEDKVHADLMTAAGREKEAHLLMMRLQADTDRMLDAYVRLCTGAASTQSLETEVAELQQQLQCHREKADEAAHLVAQLSDFRAHLQVRWACTGWSLFDRRTPIVTLNRGSHLAPQNDPGRAQAAVCWLQEEHDKALAAVRTQESELARESCGLRVVDSNSDLASQRCEQLQAELEKLEQSVACESATQQRYRELVQQVRWCLNTLHLGHSAPPGGSRHGRW
jgi:hypothetical protein